MIYNEIKNFATYNKINANIRSKKNTAAFGVCQNQKPFVACCTDNFLIYVASDFIQAQETLKQLNSVKGGFLYSA